MSKSLVQTKTRELEPLKFRFKGKIARLLGRESVSNAVVALSELVKNAYDADASRVTITFEKTKTKNGVIRVSDDGTGMTYDDFKERWMVVGTDYKERKRVSPSGRRMIGEKGIGRFAVERLGRKLEIVSKVRGQGESLHVFIDWDKYESEESYFDTIENKAILAPKDPEEHGLELILKGLRDTWDLGSLLFFKRQISVLIPPEKIEDFSVIVKTPDFPELTGEIENVIFSEAYYRLKANLDASGKVVYEIKDHDGKITKDHAVTNKTRCGPVKFTLYFYTRGLKRDEKSKYKLLSLYEVRAILDNFSGVRIYRDGFRVKPYGDPGNDWLNLNYKRLYNPKYLYADNKQVIGIVKISRDKNPNLIDTTTRERLVKNKAFDDLVNFLNDSFSHLAKHRRAQRAKEKPPKTVLRTRIERIKKEIGKTNLPERRKKRVLSVLEGIEESAVSLIMIYRNLASLGITVLAVSHEITNPISTIQTYSEALLKMALSGNLDLDRVEKTARNIENDILRIWEFIDFIVAYNRRKRRKRLKTDLKLLLKDVLRGYSAIFNKRNISVKLNVDSKMSQYHIYRGDFESILINFITNSLEALRKKKKGIIQVSLLSDKENVYLRFSDDGVGIPVENRELVFEPFYTTKEDGTGLGLKIIREIVEEYKGKVSVIDSELDKGATFEVIIPTSGLMENVGR